MYSKYKTKKTSQVFLSSKPPKKRTQHFPFFPSFFSDQNQKNQKSKEIIKSQNENKMHSFGYRANALLTFAVTILALMCAMASVSDNLNHPTPTTQVQVLNINWFQKQPNGNEEVSMTMNISADLQSLFTWNTKQVFVFLAAEYGTPKNSLNQISLWDGILPTKEHAKFWIHTSNKYRFIDQGTNLRGKEFNLTLHWHVMPKTGKMFADKIIMPGYRLPQEYR